MNCTRAPGRGREGEFEGGGTVTEKYEEGAREERDVGRDEGRNSEEGTEPRW